MAAYLEKAKFSTMLINKLEAKFPGIANDPQLYDLLHSGLRAMPRVQGTVKENYVRRVMQEVGTKVKQVPCKKTNFRDEEYDSVEYVLPEIEPNSNPFLTK